MKRNSRITFINIVAIAGYALLGFATFMGAMFSTGGSIGASVAIALGSVIILALIISGACYAKRIDNEFAKWRKVEIALAVLFWIAAIFPAIYSSHFIKVVSSSGQLSEAAQNDANAIDKMFTDYESFERNALSITHIGLESALDQPCDEPLAAYFRASSINSADDIDSWIATQRGLLLGTEGVDGFSYIDFREHVDSIVSEWLTAVKAPDLSFIAVHSGDIEAIAPEITRQLTETSAQAKLPGVEFDNGIYVARPLEQKQSFTAPELTYHQNIGSLSGSILGYIVTFLILMLIFLDYIMAKRSNKMEIQSYEGITEGNRL